MEIASTPEIITGDSLLSLLLRIDSSEIRALNDCMKKFIQDAETTGTTDEINTGLIIDMQKVVHEAKGLLNPS